MEQIQTFTSEEFGSVRTTMINDEPWFVGKDVADILGYSKSRNAIALHVDEDDALKQGLTDSLGRVQETIIINESGLYSLILSSKLPTAKKFKRWVTSEVLPSIRKNGAYLTDKKAYDITHDKSSLIDLLQQAADQLKEKDVVIERMKPKALFADAVNDSETDILIGDLAKLIKQNGHDIGQKRLFAWMRDNGYLMKNGNSKNLPTQKSMELGLFRIKERTINNPDGSVRITKTTKVTGKGQIYFVNKFCSKEE
ncbi:phage antirepressor [Absicoccus porci]|uniref:phage antirepressor n=1 Tax=Absicoccus porci TaxID=2486576 RepID=UPI003F8B7C42